LKRSGSLLTVAPLRLVLAKTLAFGEVELTVGGTNSIRETLDMLGFEEKTKQLDERPVLGLRDAIIGGQQGIGQRGCGIRGTAGNCIEIDFHTRLLSEARPQ
jgi:hypothetical protein